MCVLDNEEGQVRTRNLTAWQPRTVLLDGNHLWLVSQKDGLLYGVEVN